MPPLVCYCLLSALFPTEKAGASHTWVCMADGHLPREANDTNIGMSQTGTHILDICSALL